MLVTSSQYPIEERDMDVKTKDELRVHIHNMWAGVAGRWADHADYIDERGSVVTERMLAGAVVRPGDRVLELACGPGGAGLAAAERVGPDGEVVVSDVVPEMTSVAAARARERGLHNVRTATLDLEEIDEPDGSYDVVICRDGLMFAVDVDRAASEIHRVLRPGGRVAVAVWGPQQQNPWLGLVFDAVSAVTGMPVPPPGVPGPFALGDEVRLRRSLVVAGFTDVTVEHVPTPLRSPSFEAWWARTAAVAGPLSAILAWLDTDATAAIEDRLRTAVAPYTTDRGLELPGVNLLALATRP
jgi:ubiquinone/menaquinone biosynthesis C-methylase UbiE